MFWARDFSAHTAPGWHLIPSGIFYMAAWGLSQSEYFNFESKRVIKTQTWQTFHVWPKIQSQKECDMNDLTTNPTDFDEFLHIDASNRSSSIPY